MKYNPFNLQGKTAVVTGGAGLVGAALVKALAEAGATTIIGEIKAAQAREAAGRLKAAGLDAVFHTLDITKEKSVSNLIKFIDKRYGRMDIWVNNAYPRTSDWGEKFEAVRLSSWKENVDMHLNGYFICCQKAAEYMKNQRSGSIINMASIYGILGPDFSTYSNTSMTMPAAYSAIKGGIVNFTRYLASYYGKYNVRVNCISPGGVENKQPKAFVKRYKEKTPLLRMAKAEDIAGAAVYLASDAAGYVTGHNLVVDGGWSVI